MSKEAWASVVPGKGVCHPGGLGLKMDGASLATSDYCHVLSSRDAPCSPRHLDRPLHHR